MAKKKITDLKFDDKNFNKGTQYGKSLMEKSLSKFGAGRSILIDKNNRIIAGNKTTENFGELGLEDVQIVETDGKTLIAVRRNDIDLDTPEGREFALADNQTAKSNIDFDFDYLESELGEDTLEEWGIEIPEEEVLEAEEDNFNEAPPEEPITVLGDLIEIGEHRLLCGDSTDSDQVAKLMDGEKADMVFTDPPYNVAFNGRSGKFDVIENDNLKENEFESLIDGMVSIINILKPKNYYIWCNWKFYGLLQSKLDFKTCIVWAKNVFGLGRGYRHQHEFCLYNGKIDEGINNESDLWEVKKDTNYMHPTQKPIELASRALNNHKKNKNIVDLFCGSGLTFLASHQLKRKCFGMELDPKYCDVIIKRMLKLDDTLTLKVNGVVKDPTEY